MLVSLLLRRVSPLVLSRRLVVHSMGEEWGSLKLKNLAQQLRFYKPPVSAVWENQMEESSEGGVSSQLGVAESVALSSNSPEVCAARKWAKRAGVLICLFEGTQGDLRVILTKRSGKLSSHSGEVSLPGGKMEEGDQDESETALREAKEEIGLDPSLVKVMTTLEPFLSKHFLRVVPVVGLLLTNRESFIPVLNPGEVDEIFDAPLEMFLKDEKHRSEEREWMGFNYTVDYFDYETENKKFLIWGLTAGILIRAASIVYQQHPAFTSTTPNFDGIQKSISGHDPKL